MKVLIYAALTCLLSLAAIPAAQAQTGDQAPRAKTGGEIAAGGWAWGSGLGYVRNHFVKAAEEFPEDKYNYRPNEDTRSFGEIVMHVARANHRAAASALGREEEDVSAFAFHSKAQALAKLKESFDQLEEAFKRKPGSEDLAETIIHTSEHYGNLATYYRINGLVPPASR